jgi:hypothetical protein
MEEHDVFELRLQFLQKKSDEYLIEITATVSDSVLGRPCAAAFARVDETGELIRRRKKEP